MTTRADEAYAIFLDGKVRPHTVRARQDDCRNDYIAATGKRWPELMGAGFRVGKVRLVPVR